MFVHNHMPVLQLQLQTLQNNKKPGNVHIAGQLNALEAQTMVLFKCILADDLSEKSLLLVNHLGQSGLCNKQDWGRADAIGDRLWLEAQGVWWGEVHSTGQSKD